MILTILGVSFPTPSKMLIFWRAFVGIGFFATGFYCKDILKHKAKGLTIFALILFYLYCVNVNGMVSMVSMTYSNPILYIVNSVIGSYILLQISYNIPKVINLKIVENIGKYSIIILCNHMIIIEIVRLLDYKLFGNIFHKLGYLEGFVFGFLVLIISYMLIPIYNRYFKFIFGKR